ncbi:MAG: hypothetical protein US53_C0052G0002 [Candidatus Woesebacteria bacterium GW2011_GWA1_37_7]|uniref:Uncharacterized protein n=1 Tax=Candidatus Woesebacteria bacterium GW2011_GWA1_37_7 TaxID=1618545 RepID=A0A0G0JI30_9BACT|nr:MAG: hypothetical protein US53_C0052G0002 [Candidatus Woesebacteria bacterium GW2011_GWA1_37_7]
MENEKVVIVLNDLAVLKKVRILSNDTGNETSIEAGENNPNPVIIEGECRDISEP